MNPIEAISDEEQICMICVEPIKPDELYAIIDGSPEGHIKYHASCIQEWFNHKDNRSSRGIITRLPIISYTIYDSSNNVIVVMDLTENPQPQVITITPPSNDICKKATIVFAIIFIVAVIITFGILLSKN